MGNKPDKNVDVGLLRFFGNFWELLEIPNVFGLFGSFSGGCPEWHKACLLLCQ
jgi:hypothetical protein